MAKLAPETKYNCERFCRIPCQDFTLDSPLYKDCIEAVVHCKCNPIWKKPLFWFIGGIIFAVFVTIGRLIYMYRKGKKEKKAKAANKVVNASGGAMASKKTDALEPSHNSAHTSTQIGSTQPQAQAFVVESSVSEIPL